MDKFLYLIACALIGALLASLTNIASIFGEYENLVNQALEQNIKTEVYHIYDVTSTEDNKKYLNTTEGIQIIVTKSDDVFWSYRTGDEISVTYGRADKDDKYIYNYKITSLLSSGNEYKPVEQKKTLKWKYLQEKIED